MLIVIACLLLILVLANREAREILAALVIVGLKLAAVVALFVLAVWIGSR